MVCVSIIQLHAPIWVHLPASKASVVLVKLPTHPGGYSQWQSQTVARQEGNAAHQETTNFIYMITRTVIEFAGRPQDIQNFDNIILPMIKNGTSDLVLYCVRLEY